MGRCIVIVSWYSKNKENWLLFLKWFTPLAILCLIAVIGSGLTLMKFVVDYSEYTTSWVLPYGQALLLKHLLIIPIVAYAFINSILVKRRMVKDESFNPIPWAKDESVILWLVFSATAFLGQQSPPHDIGRTIQMKGPSNLFNLLFQGNIEDDLKVWLYFGFDSVFLSVLSLLFLSLIILSFHRPAPLSMLMSVLFVITSYLVSVQ
jgi:hypothetical protein